MKRHRKKTFFAPASRRDNDALTLAARFLLDLVIMAFFYMMLRGPLGLP